VVTFTEGDPLEDEARAEVPRPPMPSVNRARGCIGFDYGGIHSGDGLNSTQVGLVLRADITRIGGTYWKLSGYWRGRLLSHSSTVQPTLQELIDRTYTLSMTYDNPNSKWVMGFGRLYLPWAPSLDTIDGGYFGRRLHKGVTAGVFGGSAPDPASWNYEPGRRLAGTFVKRDRGGASPLAGQRSRSPKDDGGPLCAYIRGYHRPASYQCGRRAGIRRGIRPASNRRRRC
jgi:hypothetical protein